MKASRMRHAILFTVAALGATSAFAAPIYQSQFRGLDSLSHWKKEGIGTAAAKGTTLTVTQPHYQGVETTTLSYPLPVAALRGRSVTCQAMVKADGVAKPPAYWNGVKFMLVVDSPSGKKFPAAMGLWGTFGWKPVSFTADIPKDATRTTLVLGIEQTHGKAAFQNVRVEVK